MHPPLALRILAAILMLGCVSALRQFVPFGEAPSPIDNFQAFHTLVIVLLGIGAAGGLWRGERWGAKLLLAFVTVSLPRVFYPFPEEIVFLILPISFYSLVVWYAWVRTGHA